MTVSITCLLVLQGAYAIDMYFSASDGGGESVSIWDSYNVDDSVEVSGESAASFGGGLAIDDKRTIAGPGDVYAVQGYSGSGCYSGANYIYARDASRTLACGSAHLTPNTLNVVQDVSIDGADESAVVSTAYQGVRGTMQHAFVFDGSLDSKQTIKVDDGIATSQDTQMVGFLPTAFGTAGFMCVDVGPGTLNVLGEGAAVAVSSLDLAGPAEVDCKLATGTGNSAWAYGKIRSAESDLGAVGAGAGAGNVDLSIDANGNLRINGGAEAAGAGIAAVGVDNEISGTLAARTGCSGTGAFGENIEASNKDGFVGAGAAAGSVGLDVNLQNGYIGGGANAAGVGVVADGKNNEISSGTLAACTSCFGTGAFGEEIEASNKKGFVGAGAAVGSLGADVDLQNGYIGGGVDAAGVGVVAEGKKNAISSGTLAACTNCFGTGAFGEEIEASNKKGFVGAGAAAGNGGALFDMQTGFITGGAGVAGAGVVADGKKNEIKSDALGASTGCSGIEAYGEGIEGSNKKGSIGAAAVAGGAQVNLWSGYIGGWAEGAGVGVVADGKKNQIKSDTLTAETTVFGTGASGKGIEASNKEGFVGTAAGAGNLIGSIDFNNLHIYADGEGAIFGAGAAGKKNYVGVGSVEASTGDSAEVTARSVEASSDEGAAGTGAAAGNAQLNLIGWSGTVTAEGSAVGAGGVGDFAAASADCLKAESGDSTSAEGKNMWLTVIEGSGGIGAISGTYDSSGPDRVASVEGDVAAGSAMIWGDFSADTSSSASASAENVGAVGTNIHLGSHADDGTARSDVDSTLVAGGLNYGEMGAYAGDDSTRATQKYPVVGMFGIVAEAWNPPYPLAFSPKVGFGAYSVTGEARTDNTGAYAETSVV